MNRPRVRLGGVARSIPNRPRSTSQRNAEPDRDQFGIGVRGQPAEHFEEITNTIERLLIDDCTQCLSAAQGRIDDFNVSTVTSRHVDTYCRLLGD